MAMGFSQDCFQVFFAPVSLSPGIPSSSLSIAIAETQHCPVRLGEPWIVTDIQRTETAQILCKVR